MRWNVHFCIIASLCVGLTACVSGPRDPARVDYRNGFGFNNTSRSSAVSSNCTGGYVVMNGDTLSEIAELCGLPMTELARANGLNAPYTLARGQSLRMPHPPVHVVQRGENLYRISLRYAVTINELASFNGLRAPYELNVGQQIRLPNGANSLAYASNASSSGPSNTSESSSSPAQAPSEGAPSFSWPLQGRVISNFGRKPEGGRNDGINIEAREGAEVHAAAAGRVIYVGSEIAGYGRLVLIQHSNGYVSAYAHNSQFLVSEGEQVTEGQVISRVGSSGTVNSPQLHFEIHRGDNPEDPMRHLR
jgi:murein DD-endopeptidase MepM/ murein hydrolase activator NlpD